MIHQHAMEMTINHWAPPSKPFELRWEPEVADDGDDLPWNGITEEFDDEESLMARVRELNNRDCARCRSDEDDE